MLDFPLSTDQMTREEPTIAEATKQVSFVPRDIETERRSDGSIYIRSRIPLAAGVRNLPAYLRKWAELRPEHDWLAWRDGDCEDGWRSVTYASAAQTVDRLTQGLLDLGLTPGGPLFILGANSFRQALVTFAAMQAGMPVVPISTNWSTGVDGYAKLRSAVSLLNPAAIFIDEGEGSLREAVANLDTSEITVIYESGEPPLPSAVLYDDLARTSPTPDVERVLAGVDGDTVAKIMFTSGSTGLPKAAIQTHGMLCAGTTMYRQCFGRHPSAPPMRTLSWLPWSHIMGANALMLRVLADGGKLFLDDGRPTAAMFHRTLRNLQGLSLTHYSNVPLGYMMLLDALERDEALASSFFRDLEMLNYGGSALSSDVFDRYRALSRRYSGSSVVFTTAWGSTEMGPMATAVYWDAEKSGLIGLPAPGMEMKLVPFEDKYELRVKGPSVTRGYHGAPALTEAAFDSEGYYISGDLGTFIDPAHPTEGVLYAGRMAESFKLSAGTFVQVGAVRLSAIAAASPLIEDAVVTGPDRPYLGLLIWLNRSACLSFIGMDSEEAGDLADNPRIIAHIRDALHRLSIENKGLSKRIERFSILSVAPSAEAGELTEKGHINQRVARERHVLSIEQLYREPVAQGVFSVIASEVCSG